MQWHPELDCNGKPVFEPCHDQNCRFRHTPFYLDEVLYLLRIGADAYIFHSLYNFVGMYPNWATDETQRPLRDKLDIGNATTINKIPKGCDVIKVFVIDRDWLQESQLVSLFKRWNRLYQSSGSKERYEAKLKIALRASVLFSKPHFPPIMPVFTPIENYVAQLPAPEDDPFFHDLVASFPPETTVEAPNFNDLFDGITPESLQEDLDPAQVDWDELERGPWSGVFDQATASLGAYMHTAPARKGITDTGSKSLDNLQVHLREVHDTRGRKKFADVLAARGYHFEHAEILCPLCPDCTLFEYHEEFYKHFVVDHRPDVSEPFVDIVESFEKDQRQTRKIFPSLHRGYGNGNALRALRECKLVTDEVKVHCRTILSLWPDFEDHAVWSSFKGC
ncbi:hypothetical protein N0V86_004326 [Didymella sp. IMI 355093]|nr:hypothetical protein N0V86_004326 [Didymella sp. IMI 355093]